MDAYALDADESRIRKKVEVTCKAGVSLSEEIYNEGVEKGIEQGARDKLLENVRSMVKNLKITAQQALDALDVPRSEQARYIAML